MRRTLLVPTRLRRPSRLSASVLAGAALLAVPACGGDGGTDVSTAETSTIRPNANTDHVREIRRLSDFEGQMVWVIGLDFARPFAASALKDPGRVTIDFG